MTETLLDDAQFIPESFHDVVLCVDLALTIFGRVGNVWVHRCIHACMDACINACMNAYMDACIDACTDVYIHPCVGEWMHGCVSIFLKS